MCEISFLDEIKKEVERLKAELLNLENEKKALRRRIRGLEKFLSDEEANNGKV